MKRALCALLAFGFAFLGPAAAAVVAPKTSAVKGKAGVLPVGQVEAGLGAEGLAHFANFANGLTSQAAPLSPAAFREAQSLRSAAPVQELPPPTPSFEPQPSIPVAPGDKKPVRFAQEQGAHALGQRFRSAQRELLSVKAKASGLLRPDAALGDLRDAAHSLYDGKSALGGRLSAAAYADASPAVAAEAPAARRGRLRPFTAASPLAKGSLAAAAVWTALNAPSLGQLPGQAPLLGSFAHPPESIGLYIGAGLMLGVFEIAKPLAGLLFGLPLILTGDPYWALLGVAAPAAGIVLRHYTLKAKK